MSSGLDLSQFFETFFDEANELLAEMETLLLELDIDSPDADMLNAIFRAAHSIKGGAGTFGCFEHLASTTHLLENILDLVRNGEMPLRKDMIDLFLETKDVLSDQVAAYRDEQEPDQATYDRICAQLRQLAEEHKQGGAVTAPAASAAAAPAASTNVDTVAGAPAAQQATVAADPTHHTFLVTIHKASDKDLAVLRDEMSLMGELQKEAQHVDQLQLWVHTTASADDLAAVCCFVVNADQVTVEPVSDAQADPAADTLLCVRIANATDKDITVLREEMALLGTVVHEEQGEAELSVWLDTTASANDLIAVSCFVVSEDQVSVQPEALPASAQTAATPAPISEEAVPAAESSSTVSPEIATPKVEEPVTADPQDTPSATATEAAPAKEAKKPAARPAARGNSESTTIRVGVERVDQIINLVGELVITQAMLSQIASSLDPVVHDRLINGVEQLERNARDLQESVMAIRMMPMDYVFSRFPRVVRENAARLNKEIRLVTKGQSAELDKSLIERIIDPLTHLVRNSIDHGIETPEKREQAGKNREGVLTLSAQHQGGHIVIEVIDDGGGLNREKVLKKAMAQGLTTNENLPDDELWQLLFAPGFSTAEQVTDISGRGVGMDVVRRNIQSMGGHVQMYSRAGQGTTTRIVLPLTLAILDGMSVRVGQETFILPLSHVTESMQPQTEQLHQLSNNDYVMHVRGEYLPVISLREVFDVADAEQSMTKSIAVVLQAEDMRFALLVDDLIGQHQVVVKNLEANYKKIPGISAATILGDGSVALIVDVFALHRLTRNRQANLD